MRTVIALLLLLTGAPALADEVYKWVDKDGVVHYGDKPPNQKARPAELPPLQTYPADQLPDLDRLAKPAAPAPAAAPPRMSVQIVSPSQDETIRGAEAMVAVAVVVSPGLAEGQQLVYAADGQTMAGPTASTSASFPLERGTHTLTVAVVDGTGRQVARSSGVTVHLKPPVANRSSLAPPPADDDDDEDAAALPAGFSRPQPPRPLPQREAPDT